MSRRRRSRTQSPSSPHSSPIASEAAQLEQPEFSIRYAETDQDVTAIHRFLLVVARPALHCPVDPVSSLTEIIRVTKEDAALMLMRGDMLVGTMGIMRAGWWYGKAPGNEFLTDRWHFVLPELANTPAAALLFDEAKAIASAARLELVHNGKLRPAKNGVLRLMPRAHKPESE